MLAVGFLSAFSGAKIELFSIVDFAICSSALNPVAITVTLIASSIFSSITEPQMIFASSETLSLIIVEAVSMSSRLTSAEAVMLIITPFAPSIEVSKSGLDTAISAATAALSLPVALPIPICAYPASFITEVTSAKSRFTRPGRRIRSEIL